MIISLCRPSRVRWHQNLWENDVVLRPLKNFPRKSPHSRLFMTKLRIQFSFTLITLTFCKISRIISKCYSEIAYLNLTDYCKVLVLYVEKKFTFYNLHTLFLEIKKWHILKNTKISKWCNKGCNMIRHQLWAVPLTAIAIAIGRHTCQTVLNSIRESIETFQGPPLRTF